jgi:hypothetical protein
VSITLPRHAEIWLGDYIRSIARARRERKRRRGVVDIMFAVADHFEPLSGDAPAALGVRRVETWLERLPVMAAPFLDADGRHPQHTFFYPVEQYRPELLDRVAELCEVGFGEVEVHLHHDHDTADHLRAQLVEFTSTLHHRHNLLTRDRSGSIRYGFIHGNWALDNSLPDGRWCGVNGELAVLRDTGCYADFTLPSAPSAAQTRTVNQLYYATATLSGPKGHDRGVRAAVGRSASPEALLLVQGPLAATLRQPKWGVVPRLENGSLHAGLPPTLRRFADWLACGISVEGRAEWVFVKVYTHGAPEANAKVLLGPEMAAFHRDVLEMFNDGERFRLHYVTAREMVNIIHAAEDGEMGNPGRYRDYVLPPPPSRASGSHRHEQVS